MDFGHLQPHAPCQISSMRQTAPIALVICLLVLLPVACADDLESSPGRVVRIVDGDTIVIEAEGARHKVRLAGIDVPERNQPWGEAATRELRRQVAGQGVLVDWRKKDRWKRIIGIVRLGGEDMNLHLIERGLAWHFKRYADEQDPEDRKAYADAEKAAQGARRGLWSDPQPIAPWEWRKR